MDSFKEPHTTNYLEVNVLDPKNLPNIPSAPYCTIKLYENGLKKYTLRKTTQLSHGYTNGEPTTFSRTIIIPINEEFCHLSFELWFKHLVKETIGVANITAEKLAAQFQQIEANKLTSESQKKSAIKLKAEKRYSFPAKRDVEKSRTPTLKRESSKKYSLVPEEIQRRLDEKKAEKRRIAAKEKSKVSVRLEMAQMVSILVEMRYLTEEEIVVHENNLKSKRKRKEIKKLFQIDEVFYKEYQCDLVAQGEKKGFGRLYITKSYLLFRNSHHKISTNFSDITHIERKNNGTFFKEALLVETTHNTYTFENFGKRDKCFQFLMKTMQENSSTRFKLTSQDAKFLSQLESENSRNIFKFDPINLDDVRKRIKKTFIPNKFLNNSPMPTPTMEDIKRKNSFLKESINRIESSRTLKKSVASPNEQVVNDLYSPPSPQFYTKKSNKIYEESKRISSTSFTLFFSCILSLFASGAFHNVGCFFLLITLSRPFGFVDCSEFGMITSVILLSIITILLKPIIIYVSLILGHNFLSYFNLPFNDQSLLFCNTFLPLMFLPFIHGLILSVYDRCAWDFSINGKWVLVFHSIFSAAISYTGGMDAQMVQNRFLKAIQAEEERNKSITRLKKKLGRSKSLELLSTPKQAYLRKCRTTLNSPILTKQYMDSPEPYQFDRDDPLVTPTVLQAPRQRHNPRVKNTPQAVPTDTHSLQIPSTPQIAKNPSPLIERRHEEKRPEKKSTTATTATPNPTPTEDRTPFDRKNSPHLLDFDRKLVGEERRHSLDIERKWTEEDRKERKLLDEERRTYTPVTERRFITITDKKQLGVEEDRKLGTPVPEKKVAAETGDGSHNLNLIIRKLTNEDKKAATMDTKSNEKVEEKKEKEPKKPKLYL
eukprot:TRINITY_DN22872_c0_g1_i1.p1 TRINITY_DN22872_c0_g1~~TRINITY_DN22872_c0_g1_i1.p1  ORF type:complete len:882 (+),score=238.74 TRINITY_DN22872_c0_g1_i1:42-2687(+)